MSVTVASVEAPRFGMRAEIEIIATCAFANFLIFGTLSALNVAIPAMSKDMHGGVAAASWMVLGFLLANSAFTITFSKLSDELGRRWFYFGGIVVFALGSVVCALVHQDAVLIAARVLQGVASASSMSNSTAVISDVFHGDRLAMALGIFMGMGGASQLLGPVVGGWLVDHYGWRSIFWVSVPVGLVAALVGWHGLQQVHAPPLHRFRLDLPGLVTSVGGIAAVLYAAQRLGDAKTDPLPAVVGCGAAVVLLVVFVANERASVDPLLDLAVIGGHRAKIYLASLFMSLAVGGVSISVTLYLQVVRGAGAAGAGVIMLPMGFAMLGAAPLGGVLQRWLPVRYVNVLGAALAGCGVLVAAVLFAAGGPPAVLAVVLVAVGLGQGIYQSSITSRIMAGVAADRRATANGFRTTLNNGSTALSTALVIASVSLVAGSGAVGSGAPTPGARPAFVIAMTALGLLALGGAWLSARSGGECREGTKRRNTDGTARQPFLNS